MQSIEQEIRQFITDNFLFGEEADLSNDDSLLEHGIIDSTGVLELVAFLEDKHSLGNVRRNCYALHVMCETNILRSPGAKPCAPSQATLPIRR